MCEEFGDGAEEVEKGCAHRFVKRWILNLEPERFEELVDGLVSMPSVSLPEIFVRLSG